MALKSRKQVLLAKIESTYGTDSTPAGSGTNEMLVSGLEITPLDGDKVSRDLVRSNIGAQQQIHATKYVMLAFDVEVAGSGTAGDAPAWGVLMRACSMAETISAGSDVQYDPVSSGEESVSCYFFMDGIKHIALGCRGTWSLKGAKKGIPHWHFDLTCLLGTISATSNPTLDFSAFVQPIPITNVNTPTFSLDSYSAHLSAININQQNKAVYRNLVGVEEVSVTERDVAGDLTIEAPAFGTKDYFGVVSADSLVAMQLIHGITAGNIVQLDAPQVQLIDPKYTDEDGVAMLQLSTSYIETSGGDDEIKITVK